MTENFRLVRIAVAAFIAALGFAMALAPTASARTGAQAVNDARYYSAVDCPHHSTGICKDRDSQVLAGLGNGRWRIETRGWECYAWDPCGLANSIRRNGTRWYYYRWCDLENNGTRSRCTGFMGDG